MKYRTLSMLSLMVSLAFLFILMAMGFLFEGNPSEKLGTMGEWLLWGGFTIFMGLSLLLDFLWMTKPQRNSCHRHARRG